MVGKNIVTGQMSQYAITNRSGTPIELTIHTEYIIVYRYNVANGSHWFDLIYT